MPDTTTAGCLSSNVEFNLLCLRTGILRTPALLPEPRLIELWLDSEYANAIVSEFLNLP